MRLAFLIGLVAAFNPHAMLAEIVPPLTEDVRVQLAVDSQQSAEVKILPNVAPADIGSSTWKVSAERLDFRSWIWASDADVFALPVMALNSLATAGNTQAWTLIASATAATAGDRRWAAETDVFALPAMTLASLAVAASSQEGAFLVRAPEALAPAGRWAADVPASRYTAGVRDLLTIRVDGSVPVSYGPIGIAIKAADKSPEAAALGQTLVDKANARAKAQKPRTPRESKFH